MSEHGEVVPAAEVPSGREHWRSLAERAAPGGSDPFEAFVRREYPSQVHKLMDPPERREFLKLMGASLALAGVGAGCTRQPKETILPYAKNPESTIPGQPLYFATSMPWPRGAIGVLVESHEGRPTKIEGNPDHPASLGATDAITQAAILGLYDPDRSKTIKFRGRIRTWDEFLTALQEAMSGQAARKGAGLRILTQTVTSPTLGSQIRELLSRFPEARWHRWDPVQRDAKDPFQTFVPHLDRADVVVSLDADFLGGRPECVRATRDFTNRRIATSRNGPGRLYVIESAPSLTGAMADHRLILRPGEIERFACALFNRGKATAGPSGLDERLERWVEAIAEELASSHGRSLVLAGEHQPAAVHRIAANLNRTHESIGIGKPIEYVAEIDERPDGSLDSQLESIASLARDMSSGAVEALLILGGNPAYDAPADLEFARALEHVDFRVHLSQYEDETSDLCDWHVNEAHFLESWGSAKSRDGTEGCVQPLIAPLYGGKSAQQMIAAVAGRTDISDYEIVREHATRSSGASEPDAWFRRALHDGLIAGARSSADPLSDWAIDKEPASPPPPTQGLELVFRPDPTIWDGRFANNAWLQELPKPITKLVWDNAAQVSPATAATLGVENEDVVELELDGRRVRAPIWVVPGQADETVVVHLGYGRTKGGRISEGAGFNAYLLRTTKAMWSATGLKVTKTGEKRKLASTQEHDRMDGRDPVRAATLEEFRRDPGVLHRSEHGKAGAGHDTSLHEPHKQGDYSWGMVIDLNACTGCGACVAACQAENNIPVVGRDEVRRGREMHWIRVDRYFDGEPEKPEIHHQPVPCMHCENAPCEVVCPVGATVHSDEGLNEMAYNRCIGTRYCSNNCPYKVRRFNFYRYQDFETEVSKLQRNPDVSVRSRGVMEKCSYCVQRIQESRIRAKREGREIRDGEVRTACQQVCPAQAIVFGDVADPESAVAKQKADPREYGLLEELNVRPRTTYLAKLKNPNPDLAEAAGDPGR